MSKVRISKVLWTGGMLLAAAAQAIAFPITSYDTVMRVQRNSSILVTERIVADFTNDPRHGIYRDLPLTGRDSWGNKYRLRVDQLKVTNDNGVELQTQVTTQSGNLHIRIGSPDYTINNVQPYVISYRLMRGVHFFKDHDEIYWNVVGDKWEVPIQSASARVILPADVPAGKLQEASFTGYYGSTSSEATSTTPDPRTAFFKMNRPLNVGEGMTIVVGWPKGITIPPPFKQEAIWFISDNGYFFLPPLFGLGLLLLWFRAGKDPDTGKSEVVAYDPPDGLSPAEIGTLIDERVDMRDISASIIDLAVRGFIHIKDISEKGTFLTHHDYLLERIGNKDVGGRAFEKELMDALFGAKEWVHTSDLENNFYVHVPKLQEELYGSLVKRGYFTHKPQTVRESYRGAGVVILAGGIVMAIAGSSGAFAVGWGVAVAICGLMLIIMAKAMPRKTAKGKDVLLGVRGFEEYLSRAEKAEIEHQERQGYFEKFLPYAMALGIAHKWARAFDGIQTEPPQWYTGQGGVFNPVLFANDLNFAAGSWGNAMTSQPRSSGSGGSSFFGGGSGFSGGSSGGGGGGGGGGGW